MTVRVADYIASQLPEWGIDTVFLLSGGGMMHLIDAVGRTPKLRYICNHHEQACTMAADGYARRKHAPGVVYATSGPGGTNTLTGIAGAWQDSIPMLIITGQSKTSQTIHLSGIPGLRQFGTFEVDIVPMAKSITKYAEMVTDASRIRYHLEKALHLATSGRPGPVLLDIPLNIQGAPIDPAQLTGYTPEPASNVAPNNSDIAHIAALLAQASRPLILAGHGIRAANAVAPFRTLAEYLNIPVVTSQLGKDALYYDHPLFVGHPGPKGDRPGNFAVQTADVILSLGCSLHSQTTGWESELFAPTATKILIDIDPAVLARETYNVGIKLQAGVAESIEALRTVAKPCHTPQWNARCQKWKAQFAVRNEPHERPEERINFYSFIEQLSVQAPDNATIVTDAGSAFYVLGQAFRVKEQQRFISSGSLGTMGFALPAAIGAAAAAPDSAVISVTGDGSLMTNLHDLAVLRETNANVKLFVINNDGYSSIRNTQNEFCGGNLVGASRDSGVFIPAMEDLAKTFDLPYLRCDKETGLEQVIQQTLAAKGPVLCDIIAMTHQKIIPTVSSIRLPDGRMQSQPIHNMFPYIAPAELERILAVEMEDA